MTIAVTMLLEGKGQYIIHKGVVTGQDLIAYNDECLHHPERLQQLMFTLASFVEAEALKITESEAQIIGQQFSLMGQHTAQGAVVALVAPADELFALASVWEERISCECCQTATFRSFDDAEVWISQKVRENFGVEMEGVIPR